VLLEPQGEGAPLVEDIARRSQIAANRGIVDDGIFAAGATKVSPDSKREL
jgi:hypothetical protein